MDQSKTSEVPRSGTSAFMRPMPRGTLPVGRAPTDVVHPPDQVSPGTGAFIVRFYDCVLPAISLVNGTMGSERGAGDARGRQPGTWHSSGRRDDRWGTVTGTVEDTGGSALRDICVRSMRGVSSSFAWAHTDANGQYAVKSRRCAPERQGASRIASLRSTSRPSGTATTGWSSRAVDPCRDRRRPSGRRCVGPWGGIWGP